MGFFWCCPQCGTKYFYRGSKTTEAVTTCTPCNLKLRIFQYKIEEKPPETTEELPKTTIKPRLFNFNGSLESLLIMSNYAINTIKNKKQVKEKDLNSTWYQHYLSWSKWRATFQIALEEKR